MKVSGISPGIDLADEQHSRIAFQMTARTHRTKVILESSHVDSKEIQYALQSRENTGKGLDE